MTVQIVGSLLALAQCLYLASADECPDLTSRCEACIWPHTGLYTFVPPIERTDPSTNSLLYVLEFASSAGEITSFQVSAYDGGRISAFILGSSPLFVSAETAAETVRPSQKC